MVGRWFGFHDPFSGTCVNFQGGNLSLHKVSSSTSTMASWFPALLAEYSQVCFPCYIAPTIRGSHEYMINSIYIYICISCPSIVHHHTLSLSVRNTYNNPSEPPQPKKTKPKESPSSFAKTVKAPMWDNSHLPNHYNLDAWHRQHHHVPLTSPKRVRFR